MDDDDFGDFGGFETAEPGLPNAEAASVPTGVQASPSPWAVIPGLSSVPAKTQSQSPDLIQQPSLKSSTATGSPQIKKSLTESQASAFVANFDTEFDLQPGRYENGKDSHGGDTGVFPNQKLEPNLQTSSNKSNADSLTKENQSVPDGILDLELSSVSKNRESASVTSLQGTESGISLDFDLGEPKSTLEKDKKEETKITEPKAKDKQEVNSSGQRLGSSSRSETLVLNTTLEEEKTKIQRELNEMLQRHGELDKVLSNCTQKLKEQKEMYQTLQDKHKKEIEELRKAGQDSLTIIVDEYKELVKTTVLEQQEIFQTKLQEALKEEREKCCEVLKDQQDELKLQLEEERVKIMDKMSLAIEELKEEHKEAVTKAIGTEEEKHKESMKTSMQAERDASQKAIEEAVQAEREKTRTFIEEEKTKLSQVLKEEQEKTAKAVQESVEAERKKCQECIEIAIKEEQEKASSLLKETVQSMKEEMKIYVNEQRQADHAVRRRALGTMDLFLEGTKKQLQILLEEKPPDNHH